MDKLSVEHRFFVFYKALSIAECYFAHWKAVPKLSTKYLIKKYSKRVFKEDDRYRFYLLMKEIMAEFRNGHTFYYDRLVYGAKGMPCGFEANYHDKLKKWFITKSWIKGITAGSIITRIDGKTTEAFFITRRKYMNGADERSKRNELFQRMWLLPIKFSMELNGEKIVNINRTKIKPYKNEERPVTCKTLNKNLGYIKVTTFGRSIYEKKAINYLKKIKKFKTIIIDVRDNNGGNTPFGLIRELSNKKWKLPINTEVIQPTALQKQYPSPGLFNGKNYYTYKGTIYKKNAAKTYEPQKNAYQGNLIILVNQSTVSAAEDFVIPLKDNGVALIIGNRTKGSNGSGYFSKLDKNITIGVGAMLVRFPDGKPFEGIGIKPDLYVYPDMMDLSCGIDTVLQKALLIADKM